MISNPYHIRPSQNSLHLDTLAVDEGPVGAAVHQHIALRSRHDLGVAARDILIWHDDVAACLTTKNHRSGADGVLPAVGQTDETPAGCRRGRFWGARLELPRHLGHVACTDELGTPAAARIGHQYFVGADLELVPMKDGSRLGSQFDSVQQNFRLG
jgi:hypothetical protein